MESRITRRAQKKDTTKRVDPTPSRNPTEVAMDDTRAAWLEGIPPVRQAKVSNISRPLFLRACNNTIAVFINWAKNQLDTVDKKIGFSKKNLTESVRIAAIAIT
jgi:hypothetical protein